MGSLMPEKAAGRQPLSPALGRLLGPWYAMGRQLASSFGGALATVFLVPLPWVGIIFWLAIAQHDPRRVGFGLVGFLVGDLIGRVLGIADVPTLGGGIKANALLTSLAAAWLTIPTETSWTTQLLIAGGAAGAAAILTAAIMRGLITTIIPPLAWGFCLVAGALFVIFPTWTALAVSKTPGWFMPTNAIGWLRAFFSSLGSLLFAPTVTVGAMVAFGLLLWSRTIFLCGIAGWLAGAFAALGFQNLGVSYYWLPASYNFFIAGMGVGAVFFLPGRMSLAMGALGGYGAAIFAVVLQHVSPGWAFLPVSSALTIWVALSAFAIADERSPFGRNRSQEFPPEEAWWRDAYWAERFGRHEPLLVIPLDGAVEVAQGFNGRLSHVGRWRYALDFQRPSTSDRKDGSAPSIWEAPITAPAGGIVERTRNDVVDNPPGVVNYADNWGNYVLIRLDGGGWALLAHLRQQTVAVRTGMRVDIGTYLGMVGNSGRSPVPHLHLQVQASAELGSQTIPFRLANYQSRVEAGDALPYWHGASVPTEKAAIVAASRNPVALAVLAGIAPGIAIWTQEIAGRVPSAFRPVDHNATTTQIEIRLDAAGRHIFKITNEGILVSSLDPDAWRVLELSLGRSPLLRLLGLAVPSVPYAAQPGLIWDEPAPLALGRFAALFQPYRRRPFIYVRCCCRSAPLTAEAPLVIETILPPQRSLPLRITSQFERVRGPVRVEAEFAEGRAVYSLLSFRPGLPFGDEDDAKA